MSIPTNARELMVDVFTWMVPHEIYNVGHLALDDGNLETDSIQFALDYAINHREEYSHDHHVSQQEIEVVIAFLKFLLSLPEDEDDGNLG